MDEELTFYLNWNLRELLSYGQHPGKVSHMKGNFLLSQ